MTHPRGDAPDKPVLLPCAAVLFDCDGVLVDSDPSVQRAWARWARRYGFDPAEVVPRVHGRRAADTVADLLPAEQQAGALVDIEALELDDAASVSAIAGAGPLLDELPAGRWAVVTSGTTALARARLEAAGLPHPPVLVTADDVSEGKPAPEGYLAAAAGLGVDIASTVVVEDSGSGVAAARASGAGAVLGVGVRALDTDADVVVEDLRFVRSDSEGLSVLSRGRLR